MDRRTFLQTATASSVFTPSLVSATQARHVTIIGAGAAGLSAAYHLTRAGLQVQVLEASHAWGGRVKRLASLSNVPLDLGAEWIHDDPNVLGRMLGKGDTDLGIRTINYQPQTYQFWHNGRLRDFNALRNVYKEVKFYDTTWYGFFERFVLPMVANKIAFEAPVSEITSSGSRVSVRLSDGRSLESDKVLVTVPISVLKKGHIRFSANLKPPHLGALRHVQYGSGFKVFMKFRERFYPDMLFDKPRTRILADTWAEKLYYDAAFGKPTRDNILGLFTVSDRRLRRAGLSDGALLDDVLGELATIFGPIVKESYVTGVVQNWSATPHILGSYSMENLSARDVGTILAPVQGKLFFAGEALGGDYQSTVHGASFSAQRAARDILSS